MTPSLASGSAPLRHWAGIGPAAKAALPPLMKLHAGPSFFLTMVAQEAIVSIGGLAMVPPSPAPGGIQLLPGWSHIRSQGIDTEVGRIWRKDGTGNRLRHRLSRWPTRAQPRSSVPVDQNAVRQRACRLRHDEAKSHARYHLRRDARNLFGESGQNREEISRTSF